MSGTVSGSGKQSEFWLGTVQLGMSYGLSARNPDTDEVCRILDAAWDAGIRKLDTARAYGESEARIGIWMKRSGRRPTIATKVPSLATVTDDQAASDIGRFVSESLAALGVGHVDYLMLHRAEDMVRPGIAEALEGMLHDGRVGAVGVSCYDAAPVRAALAAFPRLGIVQAPANVADTHIADSGLQGTLPKECLLMLRSLYLQGALLLEAERLPDRLKPLAPICRLLAEASRALGLSRQGLAIGCVMAEMPGAQIVIGADSSEHVAAMAAVADELGRAIPLDLLDALASIRPTLPPDAVDPRTWPKGA